VREEGKKEEEEEGLYLQLETRERGQTNEAKSKRRRASPGGGGGEGGEKFRGQSKESRNKRLPEGGLFTNEIAEEDRPRRSRANRGVGGHRNLVLH